MTPEERQQARAELVLANKGDIRRRGTEVKREVETQYGFFMDIYELGEEEACKIDIKRLTDLHLSVRSAGRAIEPALIDYRELYCAEGREAHADKLAVYSTDRIKRMQDAASWLENVIRKKQEAATSSTHSSNTEEEVTFKRGDHDRGRSRTRRGGGDRGSSVGGGRAARRGGTTAPWGPPHRGSWAGRRTSTCRRARRREVGEMSTQDASKEPKASSAPASGER